MDDEEEDRRWLEQEHKREAQLLQACLFDARRSQQSLEEAQARASFLRHQLDREDAAAAAAEAGDGSEEGGPGGGGGDGGGDDGAGRSVSPMGHVLKSVVEGVVGSARAAIGGGSAHGNGYRPIGAAEDDDAHGSSRGGKAAWEMEKLTRQAGCAGAGCAGAPPAAAGGVRSYAALHSPPGLKSALKRSESIATGGAAASSRGVTFSPQKQAGRRAPGKGMQLQWSPSIDRVERDRQRAEAGLSSATSPMSSDASESSDGSDSSEEGSDGGAAATARGQAEEGSRAPVAVGGAGDGDDGGVDAEVASATGAAGDVPAALSPSKLKKARRKERKAKRKAKKRQKALQRGHKDFVVRRLKPEEKESLYQSRPDLQISTDWAARYYSTAEDDEDLDWIDSYGGCSRRSRHCGPDVFGVSFQCSGWLAMVLLLMLVLLLLSVLKRLVGDEGPAYNSLGPNMDMGIDGRDDRFAEAAAAHRLRGATHF